MDIRMTSTGCRWKRFSYVNYRVTWGTLYYVPVSFCEYDDVPSTTVIIVGGGRVYARAWRETMRVQMY
jgi:hypothetical protein